MIRDEISELLGQNNQEELLSLINELAYDNIYGCWTRAGLEHIVWPQIRERARWIIFADLDNLHELNETLGYEVVNERIQIAVKLLRHTDVPAAGRWFSGDELVWIICQADDRPPSNPHLAAKRILASFRAVNLSATFGIACVLSFDLAENVLPAANLVQQSKNKNKRGTIQQTGSLFFKAYAGRP